MTLRGFGLFWAWVVVVGLVCGLIGRHMGAELDLQSEVNAAGRMH